MADDLIGATRRPMNRYPRYQTQAGAGDPQAAPTSNTPAVQPRQNPWGQMLGRPVDPGMKTSPGGPSGSYMGMTRRGWGGYTGNMERFPRVIDDVNGGNLNSSPGGPAGQENPWIRNPWGMSPNAEKYRPGWMPKVPTPAPAPAPAGPPQKVFNEIKGFQDYDAAMRGTKDQAFGLLQNEAKARGTDMSAWNQDFLNSIGAQIGYKGDNAITGDMFNKARRLLFSTDAQPDGLNRTM